jgi:hypothetical protein
MCFFQDLFEIYLAHKYISSKQSQSIFILAQVLDWLSLQLETIPKFHHQLNTNFK